MKKEINCLWKNLAVLFLPLIIVSVVLFVVSCRMTAEGIESVDGDVEIPELKEFLQLGSTTFELAFSEIVELSDIAILKEDKVITFESIDIEDTFENVQSEETQINICKKRI